MKFSDIAGHKDTIQALRSMADSGKIPHAILLSGVSGIGKFRLARAFSQYVHCSNRQEGIPAGNAPHVFSTANTTIPTCISSSPS